MLEYNGNTLKAKVIAIHYANQVGDELLVTFMGGKVDISTPEQAKRVIDGFWQMTDLAIGDSHNEKAIEGIVDVEFWMYKLFNKVNGYMARSGYGDLWDKSANDR